MIGLRILLGMMQSAIFPGLRYVLVFVLDWQTQTSPLSKCGLNIVS